MDIKIYYRDTDCGGVVYYANYLDYFERARTEWMENRGVSIRELMDKGIYFVVKDAYINYKHPARYGDVLNVEVEMDQKTKASINFKYNVFNKNEGKISVTGSTKLVCVGESFNPVPIPADIMKKI
ncbi:MAG: acyl-CoA thioesterase [Elusimicrobiota bacterium]